MLFTLAGTAVLGGCDAAGGASAEEHLNRALEFRSQGDIRAAVIELKNALQRDPELTEARWQLGQAYVSLGNGAGAEKELFRAQELGRSGIELELALARAMLQQGKFKEVLGRLASATGDDHTVEINLLRGQAHLGLQDIDKAESAFRAALERDPQNAEARRGLASTAVARKELTEAGRQVELAIQAAPDDPRSWLMKGELALTQAQTEEAQSAFEEALKVKGQNSTAQLGVARALLAQGKSDEALAYLEKLEQAHPNNPLIKYFKAVALWQKRDVDGAQGALRDVLAVAPDHAPSLLLMGSTHFAKREFEQAQELLKRYLKQAPDNVAARKLLAAISIEMRQPAAAIEMLAPALRAAPEDVQVLAMLGNAHMLDRNFSKAQEYLEEAARLQPEAAQIRTQLAVSHLAAGATAQAVDELEAAVELDAKFARADFILVLTHLQRREFDQALETAQQLAKKLEGNPLPYNLMGAAYEGKQDMASARRSYEQALATRADYQVAALNLARLDLQAGDQDGAKKRYDAVLAQAPDNPHALLGLARIAGMQNDNAKAFELLEQARRQNPQALEPRVLLADTYLRMGRAGDALTAAREAESIAPQRPEVGMLLGRAQLATGELDAALATFEKLVERYPEAPEVRYRIAETMGRRGDLPGARAALEKALELRPDYGAARLALGNLLARTGEPERAAEIGRALAKEQPDSVAGLTLEGDALLAQRKFDDALAAYDKAFAQTPSGPLVIKRYVALRAGGAASAEQVLADWLSAHPDDSAVDLTLASHHQQAGRAEAAAQAYERIIERQPGNIVALNNLAWLYHERDTPRALALAERAYNLAPTKPEVTDTYGWLLIQSDRVEQGLALIDKALKLSPDNGDIRYHRAAGLAKAGDTRAARRELEDLLGSDATFSEKANAEALLRSLD